MSLVALVIENHEDLEVDLLARGVDLLDFWRGTLTPRRLRVLIGSMPPGAVTLAKVDPDSVYLSSWKPTDYLLAVLIDYFAAANFQNPKPIHRPADALQAKREAEHLAQLLEAQAERNRERDRAAGIRATKTGR